MQSLKALLASLTPGKTCKRIASFGCLCKNQAICWHMLLLARAAHDQMAAARFFQQCCCRSMYWPALTRALSHTRGKPKRQQHLLAPAALGRPLPAAPVDSPAAASTPAAPPPCSKLAAQPLLLLPLLLRLLLLGLTEPPAAQTALLFEQTAADPCLQVQQHKYQHTHQHHFMQPHAGEKKNLVVHQ